MTKGLEKMSLIKYKITYKGVARNPLPSPWAFQILLTASQRLGPNLYISSVIGVLSCAQYKLTSSIFWDFFFSIHIF